MKLVLSLGNKTGKFLRSGLFDFEQASDASVFFEHANGTSTKLIYRTDGDSRTTLTIGNLNSRGHHD